MPFVVEGRGQTLYELLYAAHYTYPGKEPRRPARCTFELTRVDRFDGKLKWVRVQEVYIRFGDTKLRVPTLIGSYQQEITNSPVTGKDQRETIMVELPVDVLIEMSKADKVAVEVNEEAGFVGGDEMKPLRWLAETIPQSIVRESQSIGTNLIKEYDAATNKATIATRNYPINPQVRTQAVYDYTGTALEWPEPFDIWLNLFIARGQNRWATIREVEIRYGKNEYVYSFARRATESNGIEVDVLQIQVPKSDFLEMCQEDKITINLGIPASAYTLDLFHKSA